MLPPKLKRQRRTKVKPKIKIAVKVDSIGSGCKFESIQQWLNSMPTDMTNRFQPSLRGELYGSKEKEGCCD